MERTKVSAASTLIMLEICATSNKAATRGATSLPKGVAGAKIASYSPAIDLTNSAKFSGNKSFVTYSINRIRMNGLSFIGKDGYEIPFHVVEIGEEKLIRTIFPLPMESSMSYSNDRKDGYGESNLTVNVNGLKFNLRGKFHYTCTYPNMYGGNGIKIIEIHSNTPNVSINEETNVPKIAIKIASD